ncbi:MAG: NAD(P)H-hydrate dehydratase [Alphaproteobacteria bacterium]
MTRPDHDAALLAVAEMYRADQAAMAAGVSGPTLMAAAGWRIAREIRRRWRPRRVSILCGPGNNGGDGFVVARLLARAGWPVRVGLTGEMSALRGDAAWAASRWRGAVEPLGPSLLDRCDLVVDALFGAGLGRPLDGVVREVVEAIDARSLDCVAVDVPSGIHGDTGAILGAAPHARLTVTFFRRKPGHLLLPGRTHCGEVVVADIGIPPSVLDAIAPRTFANGPGLWRLPSLAADTHKYRRGHALVAGGPMSGAGRLAVRAARRVGAALVTVSAPASVSSIFAGDSPGAIVLTQSDAEALRQLFADKRWNALLIGPGFGLGESTRETVLAALAVERPTVLDADALTAFRDQSATLFKAIRSPCVLTPHDGEYASLFPGAAPGSRLQRARAAAAESGAIVLLKGADTVIAAPDGRAVINDNAPPDLGTAGSGDVLAGLIVGLLAQGMDAFAAACAGAWLHGEAARPVGPGLIAEDLPEALPALLARYRPRAIG